MWPWQDSNLQSLVPKTNALSIRPQGLLLPVQDGYSKAKRKHGRTARLARKIKRVGSCAAGAGGISTLGIVSAGSRRQPTQPTCHLMPLCGACRSGPPWKNPCASRARPRRQALKKLRLRSPDRADLCEPSVCDGCRNDPGRTQTCNLWFRRPTPYPLGHRAFDVILER